MDRMIALPPSTIPSHASVRAWPEAAGTKQQTPALRPSKSEARPSQKAARTAALMGGFLAGGVARRPLTGAAVSSLGALAAERVTMELH
jgi:hypothetical protein